MHRAGWSGSKGGRATEPLWGRAWKVNELLLWPVFCRRGWNKISEDEESLCPASLCSWDSATDKKVPP